MGKWIYKFAESKVGLLIIGFVLTTILGTTINQLYQRSTWKRSQRFEILKRSLDKHEKIVNDLSELISGRVFRLERVIWAIENHIDEGRSLTEKEQKVIKERWDEYYINVIDWNEKFRVHFSRLRFVAGGDAAKLFYMGEEESKKPNTTTVYGYFRSAHNAVHNLYCCTQKLPCDNAEELLKTARLTRNNLYAKIDEFLLELYGQLDKRVWELQKFP